MFGWICARCWSVGWLDGGGGEVVDRLFSFSVTRSQTFMCILFFPS
jgi:hypothetical protein